MMIKSNNKSHVHVADANEFTIDISTVKWLVWTYVLPSLCAFGIVTNAINVLVFRQRKELKNKIYRYFLWHSIVDIMYLAFCFVRFIIKLDVFSHLHHSYWAQIYEVYVFIYIAGSLAVMMILIELLIASKRLLIIMNLNLTFKLKFRTVVVVCVALVLISLTPFPLSLRVVDQRFCEFTFENIRCVNESTRPAYAMVHANVSYLGTLKVIYYTGSVFRALVAPLVLLLLNIAITIKFRQMCSRKYSLRFSFPNARKSFAKITSMSV